MQIHSPSNRLTNPSRTVGESPLAPVVLHPDFPDTAWQVAEYKAGEHILREGENSGLVYVLQRGIVNVEGTVKLQSGRQFQAGVTKLEAGAVFGEVAMFDRRQHSASVLAHTDSQVLAVDGEQLLAFLDTHKEIGYDLFKVLLSQLAPRLRATSSRVYRFLAWGLKAYKLD